MSKACEKKPSTERAFIHMDKVFSLSFFFLNPMEIFPPIAFVNLLPLVAGRFKTNSQTTKSI